MVRVLRGFRGFGVVGAALAALAVGRAAQQLPQTREPASKAAAILTWPPALREQYIAALDKFFLTRTVKAGPRPHVLPRGSAIAAFEAGGARAIYLERFMRDERAHGVLVLQDGRI